MSIMQQSSKAQDRTLGVWFQHIQEGMIKLPRFQRFEAWDRVRITSFLNTIVNNLPVGVCLTLEVAGPEKFLSRYIVDAEPAHPGTVTQHLLDGQQRLTAFWRSMHNKYEDETFFIYLPSLTASEKEYGPDMEVRCIPRWVNKHGLRMPRWAEEPAKCLERGHIPVDLLRPGDITSTINSWLDEATKSLNPSKEDPEALQKYVRYAAIRETVKSEIGSLRERVTHFNLPYLALPSDTNKDVALQVFINMNTNSKPLSIYDIIVAEIESVAQQSLHDLEDNLKSKCPKALRYGDLSDLILSTSALLQDKTPNARGQLDMDKNQFLLNWPRMERGIQRMTSFLSTQRIFDSFRLPTNAVLAVIAAAYHVTPENGDYLAKCEKLLRRYIWSSFFTDRYENSAASGALADFKAIMALLGTPSFTEADIKSVPVLDRTDHPLATVDALMVAGWPKQTGILARGILAISTYFGGIDLADHQQASYESVQDREYHHVFPEALLAEAGLGGNLALNCALITWKTNRVIGRKDPLEYLKERVEWADEAIVRARLKSHLISYNWLSTASFIGLTGHELKSKLGSEFSDFLSKRAAIVSSAMQELATGKEPTLEALWPVP